MQKRISISVFIMFLVSILLNPVEAKLKKKYKRPEITWDEKRLYVNGKPYFIRGINYTTTNAQLKRASVEHVKKDIKLLKELNVNTIRCFSDPSHEILDVFYENDIMVIMEINNDSAYAGGWTDFKSKDQLKAYKKAAKEQVKRDKDHPAILMWCIWNDGPFGTEVVNKYTQEEMETWLKELADVIKKEDPSRPITSANMPGCNYNDLGAKFLDILGFNNYAGLHDAGEYTHSVTEQAFSKLKDIGDKYKKPIFITETGYPTLGGGGLQGKVLASLIHAARTRMTGVCIFMFADNWHKGGNPGVHDDNIEEHWGVLDKFKNKKSGYNAVQKAYAEIKKHGPIKANIEPYISPKMPNLLNIEKHKLIDDFELSYLPKKRVSGVYTGNADLKYYISSLKSWNGKRSLKLEYTPYAINTWGVIVFKLKKKVPANAKGLGLWVYRDGSQNSMSLFVVDKDKDIWKDHSIQLGEPGWAYYIVDFSKFKLVPHVIGPKANKKFDNKGFSEIQIVFKNIASQISSKIYMDSIEVLY